MALVKTAMTWKRFWRLAVPVLITLGVLAVSYSCTASGLDFLADINRKC